MVLVYILVMDKGNTIYQQTLKQTFNEQGFIFKSLRPKVFAFVLCASPAGALGEFPNLPELPASIPSARALAVRPEWSR